MTLTKNTKTPPTNKPNPRAKSSLIPGFTLVEIIVVILIFTIHWTIWFLSIVGSSRNTLASTLKLPMSGGRTVSIGSVVTQGSQGFYWSSSLTTTNSYDLYFNSSAISPANYNGRNFGVSVRCLKN